MDRKIRCRGRSVTAVVLAGGRGSRMKAEKAGLDIGGKTLLEHVLVQLQSFFDEILVSVSPGGTARAEAMLAKVRGGKVRRPPDGPRFGVVEDDAPGTGPLGGILAGLKAAANDACAVVACDIPDISVPLLRSLARAAAAADIAVPVGPAGHFEPLFAVYRKSAVPAAEALLRSGERSVLPLYDRCRTSVVKIEDAGWLRNLNTPEEYRSYLRTAAARRKGKRRAKPQRPGRPKRP